MTRILQLIELVLDSNQLAQYEVTRSLPQVGEKTSQGSALSS